MKEKLLTLIIAVFLFLPLTVNAEPTSTIVKLNHISDEALQLVKFHRYQDANKLLEYFSTRFLAETSVEEQVFTMNELRIITVAHSEAIEATANTEIQHEEIMNRVTKFRLVVDAISSSHQPLWTEMEEPIMTVFQNAKEAVHNGNSVDFHANFNSFLSLYEMIYPSLKIDLSREQIQRLDAKVNYIDKYRPQVFAKEVNQQELDALGNQLQTIFDDMTEDEADPSLWWVIISTGSTIILTLSYVGWRKFIGHKEQKKARKN